MKKLNFIIFIILCLCSCNTKLEPQNPQIKLSEEHAKMLNLIVNLHQNYSDWCIGFDTSCDNYIYSIYYKNLEEKTANSVSLKHLQYCNDVITDITNYTYYDGITEKKLDWDIHVRWNDKKITVTTKYGQCNYPLNNPDSLKTSSTDRFTAPAVEIKKIDYFTISFFTN